jgi:hypothetical protein
VGCKQAAERTNDGCCLFVGLHVCTSTGFSEEKKEKATCVFSFTHIKSAKDLSGIEAFFFGVCCSALWLARIFSSVHLFVNLVY